MGYTSSVADMQANESQTLGAEGRKEKDGYGKKEGMSEDINQ